MNKKHLMKKYSYQIDEHDVVHLFRGEDDCQQYLTNPLFSAIFKIETLEKENAELKTFKEKCKFNVSDICKDIETENKLIKARDLINKLLHCGFILPCYKKDAIIVEAEQFLKENEE